MGAGGNDFLAGGAGTDEIHGGAGDDFLVGDGNGAAFIQGKVDTLDGGLGNDIYQVRGDATSRDVILADPGGDDTVVAVNTSWSLGAGLDDLRLFDSSGSLFLTGIGNALDNVIDGIDVGRA